MGAGGQIVKSRGKYLKTLGFSEVSGISGFFENFRKADISGRSPDSGRVPR